MEIKEKMEKILKSVEYIKLYSTDGDYFDGSYFAEFIDTKGVYKDLVSFDLEGLLSAVITHLKGR